MRTDQWHVKPLIFSLALSSLLLVQVTDTFAQVAPEVAQQGYADTIFTDGKVVSMDDFSNSTSVGTVYQALAARGRSTFSELRWYPPMEAAKGSLSWVFRAKQPESVRTGP